MIELERLLVALDARYPAANNSEYVRVDTLRAILREAMRPTGGASGRYPQLMYKEGDRNHYRAVHSDEEQREAELTGYTKECDPQYQPDYPQSWVETPASGRGSDLRRVLLHNADQSRRFNEYTHNGAHWKRDDAKEHGGRGIGLHELLEQKEIELQQLVHDQLHGLTALAGAVDADQKDGDPAPSQSARK